MRRYARVWGALFVGCVFASGRGLDAFSMVAFPSAVGLYWARGKGAQSLGLILCAVLVALVSAGSWHTMTYYALVAALGVIIGAGAARHWRYGWIVVAATCCGYLVVAGQAVVFSESLQAHARSALDMLAAQFSVKTEAVDGSRQELLLSQVVWFRDHLADVGLGIMFWPVLAGACASLSLVTGMLRRAGDAAAPRGSFGEMRTTEWLVWAAILLAASWFVERSWPNAVQRLITWNAAVALAAVYWINGISILAYGFHMLHPTWVVCFAVGMVLFLFGMHPVLCFVGLFDTWSNFRKVVDKVAAARKRASGSTDDDANDNMHDADDD